MNLELLKEDINFQEEFETTQPSHPLATLLLIKCFNPTFSKEKPLVYPLKEISNIISTLF